MMAGRRPEKPKTFRSLLVDVERIASATETRAQVLRGKLQVLGAEFERLTVSEAALRAENEALREALRWVSPLLDSLIPESGRTGAPLEEACSIANRLAAALLAPEEAPRER